jgi:Ca2+-binding EF-hand superfamily protein
MTAKKMKAAPFAASCDPYYRYMQEIMSTTPRTTSTYSVRRFSTAAQPAVGQMQFFDASLLEKIKKELKSVDGNNDGMMQPEEFRKLLSLHSTNFTDHEIEMVTEAFYAGTGGRGVALDRFLDALEVAAKNPEDTDKVAKTLGIGACGA